ncbi:sulfite exporter TauE/SafE family protein [Domibacillus sp. A3M-37]|uniref:sulfite exporter TauE/SafE family protein n=1 Tax=Domibacillus sp. A3M-37 TaxID=2962037 RepID=UPI0020B89726|nr:sulfite exporter TauE/SafE family protein [Domibacillus sp. A3M-37]MCP3760842.1 sulfite exporter TauE/SafE family protein [Domibacillus sp. A3M-37]
MEWVMLLGIGLLAAAIGALVGLGGGIIIVPALLFLGGTVLLNPVSPQVAVGTSSVILIVTGLSSTLAYMKQKKVDYKLGFILFIGSAPGSILGAWANKGLSIDQFSLYFGLFMVFMSFVLMLKNRAKPVFGSRGITRTFTDNEGAHTYSIEPITGTIASFIVGFFGGLFGIGGGSLMVPAMIMLFAVPPHVAVATSMLLIFLSACVSSVTHVALGNVDWIYAAALVPGAWFGAKLGAWLNAQIASKTVVLLLRLVLILVGVRLIWQGIH